MIFGDKNTFAIEVEFSGIVPGGNDIFGRMVLWIGAISLGSWAERFVLGIAKVGLQRLLSTNKINIKEFSGESSESILTIIDNYVFGESESLEDSRRRHLDYSNSIVCPGLGEPFDDELLVSLSDGDEVLFIWLDSKSQKVLRKRVSLDDIEGAVGAFKEEVDRQLRS